jgi:hypothetical protein
MNSEFPMARVGLVCALSLGPFFSMAQAPSTINLPGTHVQESGNVAAKPGLVAQSPVSGILQPSLDTVQKTVEGLRLEKWKGGTVRTEATDNIGRILKDLHETLPPLLQLADAQSGAMTRLLPLSRNIDALYDVLLRVVDGSRIAAPAEQVMQLQQAQASLENGRQGLARRLQAEAEAEEKKVNDLEGALKAQATPVCPAPQPPAAPVCPAPTAHKAVKKRAKPPAAGAPVQPNQAPPAPK